MHHGVALKQREFCRCSTVSHRVARLQPARNDTCVRKAHVIRHLPRYSQRSGARLRATQMPAARCRSQLSRRTMVLHPNMEASRRCTAFVVVRKPITTSAARRARAASSRVLSPPERQPAKWRARASVTRKPAARWRSQLTCRTMVSHRRKEAFRRCSALP